MKGKYLLFAIDDDPVYLQMIEDALSEINSLRIQSFTSGEECLNNLYHVPDLIILDYYLNNADPNAKNGIEILEEIQKTFSDVPIIVLSGQLMPDITFDFIMKKGVHTYIVKDDNAFESLVEAVKTVIVNLEEREDD